MIALLIELSPSGLCLNFSSLWRLSSVHLTRSEPSVFTYTLTVVCVSPSQYVTLLHLNTSSGNCVSFLSPPTSYSHTASLIVTGAPGELRQRVATLEMILMLQTLPCLPLKHEN